MSAIEKYNELSKKRLSILAEMRATEEKLQALTVEMMECALQMKEVRKEIDEETEE